MQVQLIDLNGKLVFTQYLVQNRVQLNRPPIDPGLYIVRVMDAKLEVKMVSRLIFS
jgi:hypothetical protein